MIRFDDSGELPQLPAHKEGMTTHLEYAAIVNLALGVDEHPDQYNLTAFHEEGYSGLNGIVDGHDVTLIHDADGSITILIFDESGVGKQMQIVHSVDGGASYHLSLDNVGAIRHMSEASGASLDYIGGPRPTSDVSIRRISPTGDVSFEYFSHGGGQSICVSGRSGLPGSYVATNIVSHDVRVITQESLDQMFGPSCCFHSSFDAAAFDRNVAFLREGSARL